MSQRIETRTPDSRDDFCTPPEALEPVLACGEIVLDPCSGPDSMVPARRALFEGSKPHGLAADWEAIVRAELALKPVRIGRPLVFVNFPYADTEAWIRKILSYVGGEKRLTALLFDVIALHPVRSETDIWQDLIAPQADLVCFRRRRISFWLDGVPMKNPRHASQYTYWGDNAQLFYESFEKHGRVMRLREAF